MPNKLLGWNVAMQTGNPTRSVPVNQLIEDVNKAEVQRQRKSSCARRPLEYDKLETYVKMKRIALNFRMC